ncbi:acetyl-CoA carboxylase, carboxyltransferase subunit beta [Amphiplicatus metriothermophilus]|uniref:Acetyl-coenzyme A carboxylase carboxyl transferase subunit beta n=1 Tax=Amphiplicatus metriothermophilus TaxID=1519374 RepID=A0A239PKR0_9PROT|nr:acetyl-CoA carboxylase, carboxyltransferase subunit beta [Amphiplicatus metriothermophilus]MBB5517500.1 acetyl-CoA carboxylase carboxyl transferase subunit beta [Amphiplicatus metriothermophilus]SNT68165.1 acetyl-CoA carboxylase carboxyl transferase subunit beta [Amphiplicatus metriothermophilus]
MSWLSNLTPPGIKNMFKRQDSGDSLWVKCGGCGEMIFRRDLEASLQVCPSCNHHMKISVAERLKHLFDGGIYETIALPEPVMDPLRFRDEKKYVDRLKENRKKTGRNDAMEVAAGSIEGLPVIVAVQDFDFMGGSMGMALGEALIKAAEEAVARRRPLVVFTASGGARMQEGILSLMQMPRTTIAVEMLREARLPYVVVHAHPTTGGVTASFAMLGDVHFAEPGALIGFAGPRVIEQTIRETLPEGFQRAEFLLEKGMIDQVVHRKDMRQALSRLLRVLTKTGAVATPARPAIEMERPKAAGGGERAAPVPLDKAAE